MKQCRFVARFAVWLILVLLLPLCAFSSAQAQRQMERLGRGVIAIKSSTTQVYVGWRLLGNDPEDVAFNLYRSANGAAAVKVNASPITATTDYVDTPANLTTTAYTYSVKPVLSGVEVADAWANLNSGPFTLPANAPVRQYLPIPMQPTPDGGSNYDVKFCWVGDLDGDGEYDFVVDRTNDSVEARQFLQAYKRDGTMLWQMNMGPNSVNHYNITPGSSSLGIGHGDNVTVFDLDGDGKAEVIVRTANGVIFADGTTLVAPDDITQYISILDGLTGKEKARITIPNPWRSAGQMNGHMGIVYADGIKPSVFWQSSNRNADQSFNDIATTWDYRNGQLTQRWSWPFVGHTATAHQIRLADVDNDGKDEYIDIGHVLKSDGSSQINEGMLNEVIHGDRFHVTDIDPDRPGLETFLIQQNNGTGLATVYSAADKSAVIKKWYAGGVVDVGRGTVGAFVPNLLGLQFFSTQPGVFDAKGNQLYASGPFPPETIWWDADLGREFVSTIGSSATSPGIDKFNPADGSTGRILSIYSDPAAPNSPYNNYIAYGGRPQFWGDILGDWREELLCAATDNSELRIYTTKIADAAKTANALPFRIYTLMHNPQYRIQATTKGYVQSSYVDYYLGYNMTPPPPPPMVDAKLVWRGGSGATTWDVGATASWLNGSGAASVFANGDTVRFDISGNNATTVALNGTLQPGALTVYNPKDYAFGGTGTLAGAMKLTKVGAGALTLPNAYAFTGKTTVWDGALVVNGDLQQSPVTVWGGTWGGALAAGKTGGRLSGTGRFSQPATIKYRGAVSPGAGINSVGTLTFGSGLTLDDGTALVFDLSDDPTGTSKPNDRIMVLGDLRLTGNYAATNPPTPNVKIVVNPLNGQLAAGTYTLLTYTGVFTGNLSNLGVTLPAGTPYTLAAANGAVTLTVPVTRAAANVVWAGGVSGNKWDVAATQNWRRSGAADVFVSGDTVLFDSTGASNPTVALTDTLPIAGLSVNSASNYTFTGSGAIGGSGGLTKTGAGKLTLSTVNTYTGPTVVNGGVLAVATLDDAGAASAIGAASASASNLTINGGTFSLTGSQANTNRSLTLGASGGTLNVAVASSSMQISGAIAGTGALTKSGPGTLIFANANTYGGGTIINGGTIYLAGATPNSSGLGAGTVTINNGTLTMSDVQASETAAWNLVVPAGAVAQLNADGRCTLTGSLTGGGTLTFYSGYVRTDLKGDWSAFTGQINAVTDSDGGDLRITNTFGYAKSALNLGDQVYAYYNQAVPSGGTTIDLGELSGVAGATLTGGPTSGRTLTWSIGARNTSSLYAGVIANGTSTTAITKAGTGVLTLSGASTYSGITNVNAGTLRVSGSIANASTAEIKSGATLNLSGGMLTMSNVHVAAGGLLSGCGTMLANLVNDGAIEANCTGSLIINGNITNNGTLRLLNGTALKNTGTFTNNGVLDLITGPQALPTNFVNGPNGVVFNAGSVRVQQAARTGANMDVSIQSLAGHNYQLQRSSSLTAPNWQNVGAAQPGSGSVLVLSDVGGATGANQFYRIVVAP